MMGGMRGGRNSRQQRLGQPEVAPYTHGFLAILKDFFGNTKGFRYLIIFIVLGMVVDGLLQSGIVMVLKIVIDLPLPPDATRLVRLPGLIAFDSRTGPAEIVAFYQVALAEAGWEAAREPQIDADTAILSYSRNGRTLEVEAEATTDGAHVEMLTGDN